MQIVVEFFLDKVVDKLIHRRAVGILGDVAAAQFCLGL